MRPRLIALGVTAALLPGAAAAHAAVPHTVEPGETLWSIAAANGFTTPALAAFNGLPPDGVVVLGSTILIPSEAEAAAALGGAAGAPAQAAPASPATAGGAGGGGVGHTVGPGESLWSIAAANNLTTAALAAFNGLPPDGTVILGSTIRIPSEAQAAAALGGAGGTPAPAAPATAAAATPAPVASSAGGPQTTNERVDHNQIASVASAHGVDPSLASAVAWQESGFNNALTSSADARGVMQVLPSTWTWIEEELNGGPLHPASARENVHAGVMYLDHLRGQTGDERAAVAAYYQGIGSVRRIGILPETQRYVDSVMSLRAQFGG